jgi:glycine/D-amino acid oxidase-like deaminating enzyme
MAEVSGQEFDVIVVGSGPGGATVARGLSRRGQRVLILERGRNAPIRGTATQAILDLTFPGRGLTLTPELLAVTRGITTGGSSVFYYATAIDPPLEMFRRHGIELADDVDGIKAELPLGPLSDELIGPAASRIMASARELGYDWQPLPKLVSQDRCRLRPLRHGLSPRRQVDLAGLRRRGGRARCGAADRGSRRARAAIQWLGGGRGSQG